MKGGQITDSVFWMRLFIIEASQGHKVRDWNVSRYGWSPVLATEAECWGLFFFFPVGAATTVGLSWLHTSQNYLRWKNQGLNHTHCDSASRAGCKNIMTSPVWLQDRLCLSSLPTQTSLGAAAGHKTQEAGPHSNATRKPAGTKVQKSLEVCAVKLPWCSGEKKSADLQLQGGQRVISAQNRKTTSLWSPVSPSENSSWKADHNTHGFPPHNLPSLKEAGRDLEVIHANKPVCKWSC